MLKKTKDGNSTVRYRGFWFSSIVVLVVVLLGLTGRHPSALGSPPAMTQQAVGPGTNVSYTMVGHEYRQDDCSAIAAAPDGGVWVAWLSYAGDRDDIGIRL